LPLAEVADNKDHGTTAAACINLLNMPLTENFLTGNAIYRDPLALIEILRTFYSLDLILSVLSILSDRSRSRESRMFDAYPKTMRLNLEIYWAEGRFTFSVSSPMKAVCLGIIGFVSMSVRNTEEKHDLRNSQFCLL